VQELAEALLAETLLAFLAEMLLVPLHLGQLVWLARLALTVIMLQKGLLVLS
jgi:hypothetical protein